MFYTLSVVFIMLLHLIHCSLLKPMKEIIKLGKITKKE